MLCHVNQISSALTPSGNHKENHGSNHRPKVVIIEAGAFNIRGGAICTARVDEVTQLDTGEAIRDLLLDVQATDVYKTFDDEVTRRCFSVLTGEDGGEPPFRFIWIADSGDGIALARDFFKKLSTEE